MRVCVCTYACRWCIFGHLQCVRGELVCVRASVYECTCLCVHGRARAWFVCVCASCRDAVSSWRSCTTRRPTPVSRADTHTNLVLWPNILLGPPPQKLGKNMQHKGQWLVMTGHVQARTLLSHCCTAVAHCPAVALLHCCCAVALLRCRCSVACAMVHTRRKSGKVFFCASLALTFRLSSSEPNSLKKSFTKPDEPLISDRRDWQSANHSAGLSQRSSAASPAAGSRQPVQQPVQPVQHNGTTA